MVMAATQDVFELTLVRAVTSEAGEHATLAHVWWQASQQGERLVQVYVDGELTDVSVDVDQRELWLMLERSRGHRVELVAVDADDAEGLWQANADALQAWRPATADVASVAVVRDQALVVDARVRMQVDGTVVDEGALWPADEARSGFGAVFGEGGFGIDAATGPGLGGGELGIGPLGADGTAWRWRRGDLAAGAHELSLAVVDASGQVAAAATNVGAVMIERLARPAEDVVVDSGFVLRWS